MKSSLAKKILSLSTAVITVFSGMAPALASSATGSTVSAAETQTQVQTAAASFSDTANHWGQAAIEKWSGYGVVKGYNGSFRPDAPVTRAEFSTMIDNIMKYIEQGNNKFTDLNADQWYYNAILKLNAAGVLQGTDGKALPENKITRQEAAVLVAGAFQTGSVDQATTFSDSNQIATWAKDAVEGLVSKKVIGGMPDGTFKPAADLTRAEAVTIFGNLIQTLISKPGEYSQNVTGTVVINTPGAVLKNMKIAGDLYITQGVGEGEITLDNVEIAGTVHIQGGGEHSIIFNNVDVKGALIVNKYNGQVRLLATGSTSVSVVILESGAMLVTKELTGGGFETVEISADILAGQEIKLDGNFTKVVNRSAEVKITATGTIKELVAEVDTNISGAIKIEKITENGEATAKVNGAAPQPVPTTAPVVNSGGSTSGGGGNGGDSSGGNSNTVAVQSVAVNPQNVSLSVGESKQLEAVISPSNATNKKVLWTAGDASSAIIALTGEGLITAKGPGVVTVTAATEDGGFKAQAVITVKAAELGMKLSKYEGEAIDSTIQLDEAVMANSANVTLSQPGKSLIKENHYDAFVAAAAPLQKSTVSYDVYAVVTLTDRSGQPLTDTSAVGVTINGVPYSPEFGNGIGEALIPGSFVLKLNLDQPESIQKFNLVLTNEGYADTTMSLTYRPAGTVSLQEIGAITGLTTVGSELTAGALKYDGSPVNDQISYQWYRADSEQGPYTAIEGENSSVYVLTSADSGKYIRVGASADEVVVSGNALSTAFGPVEVLVSNEEVFAAIEAAYLGTNTNKNNIISNLALPSVLPAYPGVNISWSSSNETAVTPDGIVTRDQRNDLFVTLTVTLSGRAVGTHSYDLIVRAVGTDNVNTGNYVDSYFNDDYPQAYVKDGTMHVRYELNAPAEVYMVVNAVNGSWKSSVKSVLEGHAGEYSPIYVDKWPYFKVDAENVNKVQDFDTGVRLDDNHHDARIEFVIVDQSKQYTSADVTSIVFDQEAVAALDTSPPNASSYYLNASLNTVYVYYNEKLDPLSVPSAGDFTLSTGTVEAVSITNSDDEWGFLHAYVKLSVSGITEANKDSVTISYKGNAIQDTSDAKNKARTYTNFRLHSISEHFSSVTISSDRKSVIAMIDPGWEPAVNMDLYDNEEVRSRFNLEIDGQSYHPSSAAYSYSVSFVEYQLKFDTPLPEGAAVLKFNTSGIIDWAKDGFPSELLSSTVVQIPAPGIPTAQYSSGGGSIELTFAQGFDFNSSSLASGMVLKVDGVEYALRGYILSEIYGFSNGQSYSKGLRVNLNEQFSLRFKKAVEEGTDIQIKYVKVNGEDSSQLSDAAGSLLPDFDYVTVVKKQ